MRRTSNAVVSIMLAVPVMLWLGGQVFGYGVSFDKPGIPQGAKTQGPAGKGTITYAVNNPVATMKFVGTCGNNAVSTGSIDVSALTDFTGFATATDKAVENSIEGWFMSSLQFPAAVAAFQACYNSTAIGLYMTAVNKSVFKDANTWVGEVTVQGVRF